MKNILVVLFLPLVHCTVTSNNPDLFKTTPEIIERQGYPVESHTVVTEDGYILTLHRIPYSRGGGGALGPGQPVFLQHGLIMDSSHWLLNGNKSLPFILSDAGFDVWLGNARGNKYSRKHLNLSSSPFSQKYWDFSWHEMGQYDLPAVLEHISTVTRKPGEIIYIGHSMGGTMFLVYESLYQKASKYIKVVIGLAPASFQTDVRSSISNYANYVRLFEMINNMGVYEYYPFNEAFRDISYYRCMISSVTFENCMKDYFDYMGPNKAQLDKDVYINILSHNFPGTSLKTAIHFLQELHSGGDFRRYDHGTSKNMELYGSVTPPSYNLSAITIPVHIMSGLNDYLVGPKDIVKLVNALPNATNYVIPYNDFNHMDFLLAIDARKLCYNTLLDIIKKYNK